MKRFTCKRTLKSQAEFKQSAAFLNNAEVIDTLTGDVLSACHTRNGLKICAAGDDGGCLAAAMVSDAFGPAAIAGY